jgi:hypothetical protein
MLADPEPGDLVAFHYADNAVIVIDSGRIDRSSAMYFLKLKTRMARIAAKATICFAGTSLKFLRQQRQRVAKRLRCMRLHSLSGSSGRVFPDLCSASASSAILANMSCDRANSSFHRCSERISCNIHAAKASCSSAGNCDISLNAFCSRSVIGVPTILANSFFAPYSIVAVMFDAVWFL